MIKIQYNTISEIVLYRYLTMVSSLFIPKLDEIVEIKNYTNKIHNNALIVESWENNILVGIIACYANNNITKEAFITCVCVSKEFQGRGISKMMFNHLYKILKSKQFQEISLEVSKKNKKALKLYESECFKLKSERKESYILSRKI